MSEAINESLEKEFELERIILFSDAVFAIAITLLVLEIKFPEIPEDYKNINLLSLFKPTFIHFTAFIISFFFIGMSWARHLQLCRYLKKYNNGIIIFNLLLLFFIVTFPFSVSGFTENMHHNIIIPLLVYLFNIFFVSLVQFLFTHYTLKIKTGLIIKGEEAEKKYFYLQALVGLVIISITLIALNIASIVFEGSTTAIEYSICIVAVISLIIRKGIKKFKPKKSK